MLAKLTDKDGDQVWINPIHVRSVMIATGILGGHKGTQVMLSGDNLQGHRVYVRESPSHAADALNAAMPTILESGALELDEHARRPEPPPPHTDSSFH